MNATVAPLLQALPNLHNTPARTAITAPENRVQVCNRVTEVDASKVVT